MSTSTWKRPWTWNRLANPMTTLEPLTRLVVVDEVTAEADLFPLLRVLSAGDRCPPASCCGERVTRLDSQQFGSWRAGGVLEHGGLSAWPNVGAESLAPHFGGGVVFPGRSWRRGRSQPRLEGEFHPDFPGTENIRMFGVQSAADDLARALEHAGALSRGKSGTPRTSPLAGRGAHDGEAAPGHPDRSADGVRQLPPWFLENSASGR